VLGSVFDIGDVFGIVFDFGVVFGRASDVANQLFVFTFNMVMCLKACFFVTCLGMHLIFGYV
jgi:hypothetical protein